MPLSLADKVLSEEEPLQAMLVLVALVVEHLLLVVPADKAVLLADPDHSETDAEWYFISVTINVIYLLYSFSLLSTPSYSFLWLPYL